MWSISRVYLFSEFRGLSYSSPIHVGCFWVRAEPGKSMAIASAAFSFVGDSSQGAQWEQLAQSLGEEFLVD